MGMKRGGGEPFGRSRPDRMMRSRSGGATLEASREQGDAMWYAIGGFGALLYLVLIITLGVATIRNGHWVLFILGIFLPIFWIIGGLMRPSVQAA
jgi:uncharacterized membrane protein